MKVKPKEHWREVELRIFWFQLQKKLQDPGRRHPFPGWTGPVEYRLPVAHKGDNGVSDIVLCRSLFLEAEALMGMRRLSDLREYVETQAAIDSVTERDEDRQSYFVTYSK